MKKLAVLLLLIGTTISADNTLHNYMWANFQQFGTNPQRADDWYDRITHDSSSSIFTNKGYIHFLNERGNFQKIVELMPKIADNFKNDPDLQLIFVMALKKTGNVDKSDEMIIDLSRLFKTHPEIIFQATETMVRRKEPSNALAIVDDFLNAAPRRPNNYIFYFLKAQIYMQLQDFKQARENVQLCLDAHPRFPQGWLLLAMLEEQSGQLNDAIKGFTSYLEIAGPNQQIEQHLLALALKQKAASANRQIMFVNKSCMSKAMILFERKEYRAALNQINECLAQNPNDTQTRLLKAQALSALKEHDELIKCLTAWADQEPQNPTWLQTLHLLPRTGVPMERIINALTALHARHADSILPLLYLADLHTRNENTKQAVVFHRKALALVLQPELKARILYQIALVEYEDGQYENMLTTLSSIDALAVNHAPADNLRAYYYATAGGNLAQAQHYFDKAYANDHGNPHYLDTQAVIYYKKHEYQKALALLEPLAENMPEDSSILIHLAKTQQKLGKKDAAQKSIDQAQKYAFTPYEKKITKELSSQWRHS